MDLSLQDVIDRLDKAQNDVEGEVTAAFGHQEPGNGFVLRARIVPTTSMRDMSMLRTTAIQLAPYMDDIATMTGATLHIDDIEIDWVMRFSLPCKAFSYFF